MSEILALLKLFGERFVNCSDEQARIDALDRKNLVESYNAIMRFAEKVNLEEGD